MNDAIPNAEVVARLVLEEELAGLLEELGCAATDIDVHVPILGAGPTARTTEAVRSASASRQASAPARSSGRVAQ